MHVSLGADGGKKQKNMATDTKTEKIHSLNQYEAYILASKKKKNVRSYHSWLEENYGSLMEIPDEAKQATIPKCVNVWIRKGTTPTPFRYLLERPEESYEKDKEELMQCIEIAKKIDVELDIAQKDRILHLESVRLCSADSVSTSSSGSSSGSSPKSGRVSSGNHVIEEIHKIDEDAKRYKPHENCESYSEWSEITPGGFERIFDAFRFSAKEQYQNAHRVPIASELKSKASEKNLAGIYELGSLVCGDTKLWHPEVGMIASPKSTVDRSVYAKKIESFFPKYAASAAEVDPLVIVINFIRSSTSEERAALMHLAGIHTLSIASHCHGYNTGLSRKSNESIESAVMALRSNQKEIWNKAFIDRILRAFEHDIAVESSAHGMNRHINPIDRSDSDTFASYLYELVDTFPEEDRQIPPADEYMRATLETMHKFASMGNPNVFQPVQNMRNNINLMVGSSDKKQILREIRQHRRTHPIAKEKPQESGECRISKNLWNRFGMSYEDYAAKSVLYIKWKKWVDSESDPMNPPSFEDTEHILAVGMLFCIIPFIAPLPQRKPNGMDRSQDTGRTIHLISGIIMTACRMNNANTKVAPPLEYIQEAFQQERTEIKESIRSFCIREYMHIGHLHKRISLGYVGIHGRAGDKERLSINMESVWLK
jgi:hypothetical protein